jgi:hypothetical protein
MGRTAPGMRISRATRVKHLTRRRRAGYGDGEMRLILSRRSRIAAISSSIARRARSSIVKRNTLS